MGLMVRYELNTLTYITIQNYSKLNLGVIEVFIFYDLNINRAIENGNLITQGIDIYKFGLKKWKL